VARWRRPKVKLTSHTRVEFVPFIHRDILWGGTGFASGRG
jgi:hypothetical protein